MKRNLAVFDIDGTVFRSSLVIELVRALVRDGVFDPHTLDEVEADHSSWLNRTGSYETYIRHVVLVYRTHVMGKRVQDVSATTDRVIASEQGKVYRFARDMIAYLKHEGYYLLALSGSPALIVSKFAHALGFDDYMGNDFEVEDGIITVTNDFASKKELIQSFLDAHPELDGKNMLVVGDTESDIPILEEARTAIAFNPNAHLAAHALHEGWKIIVERKDVMYDVSGCAIIADVATYAPTLVPIR